MCLMPKLDSVDEKNNCEEPEINYWYPRQWVEEYRRTGTVQQWHDEYPDLFDGTRGTITPFGDGTRANLSTYALMYLLKRDEHIESLTYFRLAAQTKSKDGRREALQKHLRAWMGHDSFERLRNAIRAENITKQGFQGEPDLFCWNPANGAWFFAEAKGADNLTDTQHLWFAVCRKTLPNVLIKVCRVRPSAAERIFPERP